MTDQDTVFVVGIGLCTAVGHRAAATAAAVRARISGVREHRRYIDRFGDPVRAASVDAMSGHPHANRVGRLARTAIDEALGGQSLGLERVDAWIATTERGNPEKRDAGVASAAETLSGARNLSRVTGGNAAGVTALAEAYDAVRSGQSSLAVCLGVDSWIDSESLDELDATGRLHGQHTTWGFTPGEGAAAVVLATGETAEQLALPTLAEIRGIGTATEHCTMGTDTVCTGEGLSTAARSALGGFESSADGDDSKISRIWSDLTSEPYRGDELGFTVSRVRGSIDDACEIITPSDCLGDLGAATAPALLALAVSWWRVFPDLRTGPALVVCSDADRERRGAFVLADTPTAPEWGANPWA